VNEAESLREDKIRIDIKAVNLETAVGAGAAPLIGQIIIADDARLNGGGLNSLPLRMGWPRWRS
jgi:hypothetical protein